MKVEARNGTASPGTRNAPRFSRDTDIYGWAVEQAALLRAGQLNEIDATGLADEIDDVGSAQYDKTERALTVLLLQC